MISFVIDADILLSCICARPFSTRLPHTYAHTACLLGRFARLATLSNRSHGIRFTLAYLSAFICYISQALILFRQIIIHVNRFTVIVEMTADYFSYHMTSEPIG